MEVNKHITFLKRRGFLIKENTQTELPFDDVEQPTNIKDIPVDKLRRTKPIKPTDNKTQELDLDTPIGLDFKSLCNGDNVFCRLYDLQLDVEGNQELVNKLIKSVTDIFVKLKPTIRDNRTRFKNLINTVLDQDLDNVINVLFLISQKIDDVNTDKLKSTLNKDIPQDVIEKSIRDIKYNSYTEYENSFVGSDFDKMKTSVLLSLEDEKGVKLRFTNLVVDSINGDVTPNSVSKYMYNKIKYNVSVGKCKLIKADLKSKKTLLDNNGNPIIGKNGFVEVKKMGHYDNSYLSEFFAIYKNPIPEILNTDHGLSYYNEVISGLCDSLKTNDGGIIDTIRSTMDGMMFDNNIFVRTEDIDFFWSDKGQRVKDKRLSIRFQVKSGAKLYFYDKENSLLIPN